MGVWLSWLEHLPCKQGGIGSNPIISTKKKRPWVVFLLSNTDSNACNRTLLTLSKRRPWGHRWRPSLRAGRRLFPPQSTKVVFFRNKKRRKCVFFYLSGLTLYEPRQTQTRSNSHQINPKPMKWSKNLHKNTFVLWQ